jgi:hypothetical protein
MNTMARNKKEKRLNLPQETLERARAEMRGEIYIPDADDFEDEHPEPVKATVATTAIKAKSDKPSTKQVTSSVPTAKVKRGATTARRVPAISELLEEYHYVIRDLRHLAVLAVSLLVAVVVISFILAHV